MCYPNFPSQFHSGEERKSSYELLFPDLLTRARENSDVVGGEPKCKRGSYLKKNEIRTMNKGCVPETRISQKNLVRHFYREKSI
jgi:hypothetical protein